MNKYLVLTDKLVPSLVPCEPAIKILMLYIYNTTNGNNRKWPSNII